MPSLPALTLTAKPANKHLFLGWTGDCGGTSPTCTFTIVGDASVGAIFD